MEALARLVCCQSATNGCFPHHMPNIRKESWVISEYLCLNLHLYLYMYICMCVYVYMYTHTCNFILQYIHTRSVRCLYKSITENVPLFSPNASSASLLQPQPSTWGDLNFETPPSKTPTPPELGATPLRAGPSDFPAAEPSDAQGYPRMVLSLRK